MLAGMTNDTHASADPSWHNDPVAPQTLPAHADVELQPVAPTYRRYTLITTLLGWAPTVAVVAVLWWWRGEPATAWIHAGLTAATFSAGAAIALWRWIEAGYRGWALREHDLIARSGVLWRSTTVLPIARIQHVETAHGPIERLHGLGRLKLFTAGGMTADVVLPGLGREDADNLREHLVEQIRLREADVDDRITNPA